jgi:very-short-patch-repair endonuclease
MDISGFFVIFIIAVTLAVSVLIFAIKSRQDIQNSKSKGNKRGSKNSVGKFIGSYSPRQIMTADELEFFHRLVAANPNGYVFPKVAMPALINPAVSPNRQQMAFNQIAPKRVDYAIYTGSMTLLCVVELDDSVHTAQIQKDRLRDAMLTTAGIKTLRWESSNKPAVAEINAALREITRPDPTNKRRSTVPNDTFSKTSTELKDKWRYQESRAQ